MQAFAQDDDWGEVDCGSCTTPLARTGACVAHYHANSIVSLPHLSGFPDPGPVSRASGSIGLLCDFPMTTPQTRG